MSPSLRSFLIAGTVLYPQQWFLTANVLDKCKPDTIDSNEHNGARRSVEFVHADMGNRAGTIL